MMRAYICAKFLGIGGSAVQKVLSREYAIFAVFFFDLNICDSAVLHVIKSIVPNEILYVAKADMEQDDNNTDVIRSWHIWIRYSSRMLRPMSSLYKLALFSVDVVFNSSGKPHVESEIPQPRSCSVRGFLRQHTVQSYADGNMLSVMENTLPSWFCIFFKYQYPESPSLYRRLFYCINRVRVRCESSDRMTCPLP